MSEFNFNNTSAVPFGAYSMSDPDYDLVFLRHASGLYIGMHDIGYDEYYSGGAVNQWFMGPDQTSGYIIAKNVNGAPMFWRSSSKISPAFTALTGQVFGTTYDNITLARAALDINDYYYTNPVTGSLEFDGVTRIYARADWENGAFDVGDGPFTVEWYQKLTTNQRGAIFSTYTSGAFACYVSRYSINFTVSGEGALIETLSLLNAWFHIAISKDQFGMQRIFLNGALISEYGGSTTYNLTNYLVIGIDPNDINNSKFAGLISNFHFVKGSALYVRPFTVPNSPIMPTRKSSLLLWAPTEGDMFHDYSPAQTSVTLGDSRYPVIQNRLIPYN